MKIEYVLGCSSPRKVKFYDGNYIGALCLYRAKKKKKGKISKLTNNTNVNSHFMTS